MSALLPAHRRAERFAALVDAASTTAGTRDAQFLELVAALRRAAQETPTPRAAHVSDLRSRLMIAADTVLVPTDRRLVLPRRPSSSRHRRLTAAAAALAVVGGTAGTSVAARGSLPSDALYPLKRSIEQVYEAFSFSDAARGQDLLHQADARLSELDSMLAGGASDTAVAANLRSFTASAGDGADLLFTTYQSNGDADSVSLVRSFAGSSMGELDDLARRATRSPQPDFTRAAQLLADLDQQARVLCSQCGARDALRVPSDLALPSSNGNVGKLLDVPAGAASSAGGTGQQTGSGNATDASTSGATSADPQVTVPDPGGLLGGQPATSPTTGDTGSVGDPLGGLLDPEPTSGSSDDVDLNVDADAEVDVDKHVKPVKKTVGDITDPLPKP